MSPKNSPVLKRLAIVTTHHIQYNAPIFQLLSRRKKIEIKVFYTWGEDVLKEKYDPGFAKTVEWDIPLMDGYEHEFLLNSAKAKGAHHFFGIQNPDAIRKISEWRPDALLVFGWSYDSHLRILNWAKGKVKVLFRGDSTLLDNSLKWDLKRIVRQQFLRWVYKRVDYALYTGLASKEYYRWSGLNERQLIFTPHAIDNARFAEAGHDAQEKAKLWRKELGISQKDTVFLFAGKLEAKKNPNGLLDAFLQAKLKNSHLIFCGSGELENELRSVVSSCSNVHLTGFQNQSIMPIVYRLGDVFVLPSKGPGETWGLAVNEAMACSKPVLVSQRCGCAADLVKEGKNGCSFNPFDQKELIQKIHLINENKNELENWGKESSNIIKGYSIEKVAFCIEMAVNNI